ncbi:glycogen/starch/alpha-glucan phosphorylase [Candidatus Nanosynbacter sp. BB002]|uniref:glycogen/starch/alpha-glucan phosphorylase n=1 Tax=Candidatus Nanosynbacter sp. BB002 TaxID=3393757 RepID=UPI0030D4538C
MDPYFYTEKPKYRPHDIEDASEFYDIIERSSLTHQLSDSRPYIYWTMEIYDKANGIKGGGGLGVLAADTRRVAEKLDVPFVVVTPFYRSESHQKITNLEQEEFSETVSPQDYGFEYIDDVSVSSRGFPDASLSIFKKALGSTQFVTISEPNFGQLYEGEGSGDHRLYQEVALGFGGYKALKLLGIKPAVIQLNETATIFAALARLDELCANGMNLYEAIVYVRKHTLYTNHTLLQAAEPEFHRSQFEKLVLPNLKSNAVRCWLMEQFRNDRLRPNLLAIELTEAKNGVSKLHARVANFRDRNNDKVKFHAITNGIDLETWVLPEIMQLYSESGIIDKFGLPTDNFHAKIDTLTASDLRAMHRAGRAALNRVLEHRKDQYNHPVQIPENALLFDFKRRFANYKRPYMPFTNPKALRQILVDYNAHYILAGKVHQGDTVMYQRLLEILQLVDADPILKERVHYIQDYDEELGRALAVGSNIAINVPEVGWEACGTSWEKDIANLKLLISTSDGGVADIKPIACLEVSGKNYDEEVRSLYLNIHKAARIMQNDSLLEKLTHRQLKAYLPIISGARMMKDYLHFLFPKR